MVYVMRHKPKTMMLSVARLRDVLHYSPDTGKWRWLVSFTNGIISGMVAGSIGKDGYRKIGIDGVSYRSIRLAVLYMTGRWPKDQVDHIDGNPINDRWENLREADLIQNQHNSRKHRDRSSSFKGMTKSKTPRSKPYIARIKVGDRRLFLGYFVTPEEAHAAYVAAAEKHFGEFARAE